MDIIQHENRCDAFRFNHKERIETFVDVAASSGSEGLVQTSQLARAVDRR